MTTDQTETILVLEEDILVRNPLAEYLRGCGYRIIEVSSAEQARQVLEASDAKIDVLFASAGGDAAAAFSLASWARTYQPDVDVVLAGTVRTAVEKAGGLCEDGPALSKPYDHSHVLDRIQRLTAARRRAEPAADRQG
jgi:DNA-binding response OmpR family regulator